MNAQKVEIITAVHVLDPESGRVLADQDIVIDGDRISRIEPSVGRSVPGSIDGKGLFALPGLIDSHVHSLGFCTDEFPTPLDMMWIFRQQRRNLAAYLGSGITTIRDMGSSLERIRGMARKAERLDIESPRILYAGPLFTVARGYPYYVPSLPRPLRDLIGTLRVDLREEGRRGGPEEEVDRVVAAGARCIKIMYQSARYDEARTRIPTPSLGLIARVVERAHERGVPAAIHHTYRKDLQDLLDTDIPFDSLEHLTTDDLLSPDDVEKLARRGIPVSSTLSTYGIVHHAEELERLVQRKPERFEKKPARFFRRMCRAVRAGAPAMRLMSRGYLDNASRFMSANLGKLRDAGVRIVFATDSGIMSPPGCPLWEFEDMIRAGMTPIDALRAATCLAADVVGMPDLGRLAAGKKADLVLLRGNPLEEIEAVERVAAVIRDGLLVHEARS